MTWPPPQPGVSIEGFTGLDSRLAFAVRMKIPLSEELGRGHHSGGAWKKAASLDELFLEAPGLS